MTVASISNLSAQYGTVRTTLQAKCDVASNLRENGIRNVNQKKNELHAA